MRELPDIDPPIVSVLTVYPGANASVVKTEVTERLEEVINNIEGIKTLTSQSREEASTITVEFDLSRDIDQAAQDVRDRVARVRGLLPTDIKEPIVAKQEADANPIIWIGVNSARFTPLQMTTLAERQIKNRLQTIKGVSSVIHPLTVMLAVPLAGVGAFGLLWLVNFIGTMTSHPVPAMNINLFSQIGLVLLVGLVTKNSILLVEFANQQHEKGANAHDAMVQTGLVRLRPILMTAFCTIAGILPIAIGFGAGAESRRPMGVAVVGGILTSTFLTLIIIPVVYTLFSDLTEKLGRKKTPATYPVEPAPAAR